MSLMTLVRSRAQDRRQAVSGLNLGTTDPPETVRGTFVLSFDFEDWHQLVHRRIGRPDWRAGSGEFDQQIATLLDLLDELSVSATFFVAGVTADRHPAALAEVAARGHEIGCHGYEHRRAYRQTPEEFRRDVVRCVNAVEGICGVTPVGYRAPWFSITRDSLWAGDILRELGFRYDSSLYDSPRIPRRIQPIPAHPCRIGGDGDALLEFPVAVWRWGRIVVPLGGGAYWRALPSAVLWRGLENISRRTTFPVLYFHPYEFSHKPLRVVLPPHASRRQRGRETWRRVSKNMRRDLIRPRLGEAAARFQLVPFRDILGAAGDDFDAKLLRQARARV
jgi:polysaccharide deacetylase family protein (PEP-CTERM system associated)